MSKTQRAERRAAHEGRLAVHQALSLREKLEKVAARGGSRRELDRLTKLAAAAEVKA